MSSEIFYRSQSNGDNGDYFSVYTGSRGSEDCFLLSSADGDGNEIHTRLTRSDAEALISALRRDLDKGTPGQAVRTRKAEEAAKDDGGLNVHKEYSETGYCHNRSGGFYCTRPADHTEDHIAHGVNDFPAVHRWPANPGNYTGRDSL